MAGTYQLDGLTTGDRSAAGAAAQEAWRDWCCRVHGHFDFEFDDHSYRGRVVRQHTRTYQLIAWTGETEVVKRSARSIRRDPRGHYELLVPLRGRFKVGHDDEASWIRPGDMALIPMDLPSAVAHATGAAALTLLVPVGLVEQRLGPAVVRSQKIVGDKGLSRVSRDFVVSLLRQRAHLSGPEFDAACDRVVDLVCLAVDGGQRLPEQTAGAAVADAVRRYVREHVTDPGLSVSAMASAIGWSPRYIQAVLAREGTTPTELIRTQRLDLAHAKLSNPNLAGQTITAIAASVGFTSSSAFSQAYRQRFGCSPRDARPLHRRGQ
ncbi:helix-turn-helix domain-containing protein [Streptomyces caeni]|uniref:Helix-turn-helix domain-containing protein n=1 Tax=Streptomyces caeni TaxID=2307231 RepID=A0ABW4IRS1_9ACTN